MTSSITRSSDLTTRLLTTLSQEQRTLQQENAQAIDALEGAVDARDAVIKAQADEIALLKARLEQKETELQSARTAYQVHLGFTQEQQEVIAQLRGKNSQLTESDQKFKEILALYNVLRDTTSSEKLRILPYLNGNYMDQYEINDWLERFEREMRGGHYEPIIAILKNSLAAAPKEAIL